MIIGLEHTIRQQKMEIQHYKQQAQQSDERMTKLQAECMAEREREASKVEQESKEIEELKEHVNKLEDEKHSMEILLDVYKGVPKEQRDRAQVSVYTIYRFANTHSLTHCLSHTCAHVHTHTH